MKKNLQDLKLSESLPKNNDKVYEVMVKDCANLFKAHFGEYCHYTDVKCKSCPLETVPKIKKWFNGE